MTTQQYKRPDTSAPNGGEAGLPNREKFQAISATTPRIPISSEDMDSELNTLIDAVNELFDLGTSGVVPDNSVTLAKLAHLTAGSMYYFDGTGTPSELAIGGSGEVLSVSGGIPTWSAVAGTPTGVTAPFAGSSAPSGWLLCDGSAVSRATYADLFATISTTYGVGDGSTTFNLPDLRGRNPLGLDNMGGTSANRVTSAQADTLGGTLGSETDSGSGTTSGTTDGHTLTTAQIPSHSHTISPVTVAATGFGGTNLGRTVQDGATSSNTTDAAGGGGSHSHGLTNVPTTITMDTGANMSPQLSMNYIIKT